MLNSIKIKIMSVLIVFVLSSVTTVSQTCLRCAPGEQIQNSNVMDLQTNIVGDSIGFRVQFSSNSENLVAIHSRAAAGLSSNGELIPNAIHVWQFSENDGFIIWDFERSFRADESYTIFDTDTETQIMVAGNNSGLVEFWSLEDNLLLGTVDIGGSVTHLESTMVADTILAIIDENLLLRYNRTNDNIEILQTSQPNIIFSQIAVSIGQDVLYLLEENGTLLSSQLTIWDLADYSQTDLTLSFEGHIYQVVPDSVENNVFWSITEDFITQWHWDLAESVIEQMRQFPTPKNYDGSITTVAINFDSTLMVMIEDEQSIIAVDLETGNEIDVPYLQGFDLVNSNSSSRLFDVSFSPDGLYLAIGTSAGIVIAIIP